MLRTLGCCLGGACSLPLHSPQHLQLLWGAVLELRRTKPSEHKLLPSASPGALYAWGCLQQGLSSMVWVGHMSRTTPSSLV